MNFLGKLFGSDKAVDDILDKDKGLLAKAGGWIGNFNFTEEEQAENRNKVMELGLQRLKALEPFKVMQRIMVTIIMIEWAILFNNIIVAIWIGNKNVIEMLMDFAMSEFAWMPVLAAVTLYLLGGVMPSRKK